MNKSKLKYICFCLFIILACIVINAFTSGIDLKMGLVNEDINKYIIEHQANTESLQVLKDEKTNLMTLQILLISTQKGIKEMKQTNKKTYPLPSDLSMLQKNITTPSIKTLLDNIKNIQTLREDNKAMISNTINALITELNIIAIPVLIKKISQKENKITQPDTDGGDESTTFTQGNFYKYNCTGSDFTRPCFSVMTEEEICKDNVKDCPSVSDNSNDSDDDGGIMSTIGNLLNSDKKKCPKLNKVLWGDSWACPAPQPCSKETPT